MAVAALLIWSVVKSSPSPSKEILNLTFSQFTHEIAQDNVLEVTIASSENAGIFSVQGVLRKGNKAFKTAAPASYTDWLKALAEKNASITFDDSPHTSWMTWVANGMPLILILGLWFFIMRQMQKGKRQWIEPAGRRENS
jgi:cell division protease FtsH